MNSPIRPVHIADAARIVEIYSHAIVDSPISFEYEVPSVAEMESRIRDVTTKFYWLVYEAGGRIVGYAYAGPFRSRCAYDWSVESTVYIDPAYHGQGIGKKLYHELFRLLKDQGAVNVIAGITLPNTASVGLHESMGFKQVAEFPDVGFKLGQWWAVGYWQLQLQKPAAPKTLKRPD